MPNSSHSLRATGEILRRSAAAGAGAAWAAFSTSSRVMRPPGPLPVTVAGSMPSSSHSLRAIGDIFTRSPDAAALDGAAGAGAGAGAGGGAAGAAAG